LAITEIVSFGVNSWRTTNRLHLNVYLCSQVQIDS